MPQQSGNMQTMLPDFIDAPRARAVIAVLWSLAASSAPATAQRIEPRVDECRTMPPQWIWCDDFEVDRLRSYFEHDERSGSFTRAPGVGVGNSTGMRARFDVGQVSAGSLKLAFGRTPDRYIRPVDGGESVHRDIHWRVYVRNHPTWRGGGGDKFFRAQSLVSSTWAQGAIAAVWSGRGDTRDMLVLDPHSGAGTDGTVRASRYNEFSRIRWLGVGRTRTPVFATSNVGNWFCVEARVRLEDEGESNGVFELWINDRLEARRSGLRWGGTTSGYGINTVFIENYWNDGSPFAQERYFDNLVVSTAPIGC